MSIQAVSIGESIRTRRLYLRLSQRDLACAAGTTAAAVSHIERGARKLSASLLARIADALQCSADALLEGATKPPQRSSYLLQVLVAMKGFSPPLQKEVAEFCKYLKHRRRGR